MQTKSKTPQVKSPLQHCVADLIVKAEAFIDYLISDEHGFLDDEFCQLCNEYTEAVAEAEHIFGIEMPEETFDIRISQDASPQKGTSLMEG